MNLPSDCFYRDPAEYPPVRSLHEVLSAQQDSVFLEPVGTNRVMRAAPVFHEKRSIPLFPNLTGAYEVVRPQQFVLVRHDVVVAGYRCCIGKDGGFNLDECIVGSDARARLLDRLVGNDELQHELIGFRRGKNELLNFDLGARRVFRIEGSVVVLSSTEPTNYGSFLFRILPKLAALRHADPGLRVLVPLYYHSFRQLLELAGFSGEQIIPHYVDQIYEVERAIIPSLRNPECWLDEQSIRFYDDLRKKFGTSRRTGRKLFLTRAGLRLHAAGSGGRTMQNEEAVRRMLLDKQFAIIEPSLLTVEEQISEFSSAELIVTASGSAMFNVVFCAPGVKVIDIESEPHWIHAHMCLFGSRGASFEIFEATVTSTEARQHLPFEVDVDRLARSVDRLSLVQGKME